MTHRVLLITENHPPDRGGMAESCDRIARGLGRMGAALDIVHFDRRASRLSFRETSSGSHLRQPPVADAAHSINVLWNAVRRFIDLDAVTHVVAFGGQMPLLAAPAYAAWMHRPLITLLRGNELDAGLFDPRRRPILDDALLRSAAVCVVTSEQAEKIVALHPEIAPHLIGNGIDFDSWQATGADGTRAALLRNECLQSAIEPGPTGRILGFFGQLKAKKGVPFFLDVLRRSGLESRFHTLLVGEPDAELQEWLAGHPDSRSVHPPMDRFDLIPIYLACDLVVLPSHYDGFPNVLIEAAALGKPLVATAVGGMRDMLVDGETAILFPPGDEHECRRAIDRAASMDDDSLVAMGGRAAAVARERCDGNDEARRYMEILDATARRAVRSRAFRSVE